jgi:CheY-like chemotaxis protein
MSQFAPPTILVVDDDPVALFLAETTLEAAGYPVLTAGSGPEAILALYKNPNIAVLFTDIKMPTIDGFMLADMAKLRRPDLKVLYATGFAEEVSTQPGFRYGKILDKPYEAQQLCDEVRLLLGTCLPSTPAARVNPSPRPGLY